MSACSAPRSSARSSGSSAPSGCSSSLDSPPRLGGMSSRSRQRNLDTYPLRGGHIVQLVVHRGDQLVRLDPHAAQRVSQLAEDVLLEQIPLTLTEQLAVPRDRGG